MGGKQILKLLALILVISREISGTEEDGFGLRNDENFCKSDNLELVKLSPYNQADVYLISQMMVVLTALEA